MATSQSDVQYASTDEVLLALDKDPDTVRSDLRSRAEKRAKAATQKWIKRTGHPFHDVRVGNPDEPRSWEIHNGQDVSSLRPVDLQLDNGPVMPIDPEKGDAIEVRTGRDTWEDITGQEGDEWALDYRTRRLTLYRRRFHRRVPFDDPRDRFVRLTYRHGPLGEDITIDENDVVTTVPPDVAEAVAAKAAMNLVLGDDNVTSIPDDGQLAGRSTIRSALKETWESAAADYTGFSTL